MWMCCDAFCASRAWRSQHVMNITDVDDKIMRNAAAARAARSASIRRRTKRRSLKTWRRWGSSGRRLIARATECIPEMVTLVEQLAEKEFRVPGGGWLVVLPCGADASTASWRRRIWTRLKTARGWSLDEFDKDAARDFALWKAVKALPDGSKEALGDAAGRGPAGVAS